MDDDDGDRDQMIIFCVKDDDDDADRSRSVEGLRSEVKYHGLRLPYDHWPDQTRLPYDQTTHIDDNDGAGERCYHELFQIILQLSQLSENANKSSGKIHLGWYNGKSWVIRWKILGTRVYGGKSVKNMLKKNTGVIF